MSNNIRIIVVNASAEDEASLRSDLLGVEGVRIVAEAADVSGLDEVVQTHPAEVVLVNLDLPVDGLLGRIKELAGRYPERSIFGFSRSEDSRLILAAMRAGVREFFVRPFDRPQLVEALARLATFKPAAVRSGKVIAVVGSVGGAGTTVLAVNLAGELSTLCRRGVALVDLDLSGGHVATLLDVAAPFALADVCGRSEPVDPDLAVKAMVRSGSNLHVLAGVPPFLPARRVTLSQCAVVVNALTERFDYVVCDGPSRADPLRRAILEMADTVLVVLHPMVPAIRNTEQWLASLKGDGLNLDRVRLVLNRYDRETSSFHPADLEETLGRPMDAVVPEDGPTVARSINLGRPLAVTAGKSKVCEAIRRLAVRIHDPQAPEVKSGGGSRRLARMFGMA